MESYKTVGCSVTGKLVLNDLRWLLDETADYPGDSVIEVHSGQDMPVGGRSPDIVIVRPHPAGGDDGDLPVSTQTG